MSNNKRSASAIPASQDGSSKLAKTEEKFKYPHALYFEKLWARFKANDEKVLGYTIIKFVSSSDDSDDEDDSEGEEEKDKSKYTSDQMASLRIVFITQNRSDQLDKMERFVLGDQADQPLMMFGTSYSYGVYNGFFRFKSGMYAKTKGQAAKFDLLFAYTYQLKTYDVWILDNEGEMDDMVAGLAAMWKRLLKNDDATLGIDAEYSRPGVLQLLQDFKEQVEASVTEPPFKFNYM